MGISGGQLWSGSSNMTMQRLNKENGGRQGGSRECRQLNHDKEKAGSWTQDKLLPWAVSKFYKILNLYGACLIVLILASILMF